MSKMEKIEMFRKPGGDVDVPMTTSVEAPTLRVSVIILAKDEGKTISDCLQAISQQTILNDPKTALEIIVVPNGCTDNTALVATDAGNYFEHYDQVTFQVHNLTQGGKSRSWNRAVHEFAAPNGDLRFFLDADITLCAHDVMANMVSYLLANPQFEVVTGKPAKDYHFKKNKNLAEKFSLKVSRETAYVNAISGGCYVARAPALSKIWLPNDTPGEDGFLNAMITTDGFTVSPPKRCVRQYPEVTHIFEGERVSSFSRHEKRLIVGTVINTWIFEHLQKMKHSEPCGYWIREENERNPNWIDDIVSKRVGNHSWVVPPRIFRQRLLRRHLPLVPYLMSLPIRLAAAAISVPAILGANRLLKRRGAASFW